MNGNPAEYSIIPGTRARVALACQECGVAFDLPLSRVLLGRGKHCSRECAGKSKSRLYKITPTRPKQAYPTGPDHPSWIPRQPRPCPVCGTIFDRLGAKTCSRACGIRFQADQISGARNTNYKDEDTYLARRYRRLLLDDSACYVCGRTSVRIMAHHIDGDRSHNVAENLKPLCRPCHNAIHYLASIRDRDIDLRKLDELIEALPSTMGD